MFLVLSLLRHIVCVLALSSHCGRSAKASGPAWLLALCNRYVNSSFSSATAPYFTSTRSLNRAALYPLRYPIGHSRCCVSLLSYFMDWVRAQIGRKARSSSGGIGYGRQDEAMQSAGHPCVVRGPASTSTYEYPEWPYPAREWRRIATLYMTAEPLLACDVCEAVNRVPNAAAPHTARLPQAQQLPDQEFCL
jgi:hypothetical protein